MESVAPPSVRDVRDHVTCRVCHGYLIDAVTVVRCLHTCEYRPIVATHNSRSLELTLYRLQTDGNKTYVDFRVTRNIRMYC